MARVRVKVAWPGEHHHRNGVTMVTPGRCRHFEREFAAMRAEGIRFPVPWGHQGAALPADPLVSDSAAFLASKFNAGEIDALESDPEDGGTVAVIDAPGVKVEDGQLVSVAELPDGTPVKTAIREVSPLIGCTWKDGKGREWSDILAHVALTPFPVQAGQQGFQPLSADAPLGGVYLATGAKAMPDPKKPGATDGDTAEPETPSTDPELQDELTQAADDDAGEEVPGGEPPAAGPEADRVSRILATLAEFGVPLPPDTDPANILERLDSALLVAKAMKAAQPQTPAQPAAPQRETPMPAPAPGVMMASLPPQIQANIRTNFKRERAGKLDKITELERRGLPVATANRLRGEVTAVKLSLDADGNFRKADVDAALAVLDETLPGKDDPQSLLSTATPVTSPADGGGGAAELYPEYGNDLPMTVAQKADVDRRVAAVTGRKPK